MRVLSKFFKYIHYNFLYRQVFLKTWVPKLLESITINIFVKPFEEFDGAMDHIIIRIGI